MNSKLSGGNITKGVEEAESKCSQFGVHSWIPQPRGRRVVIIYIS